MKPLFIGEPTGDKDFAWIYNALKEIIRISHEQTAVLAGPGLTGGGALGEDQQLAVGAGTGITVTDDAVSLSPIAAWSLFANTTAASAVATGVGLDDLTEKTTLHADDWLLIADSEASFALKKAKRSNVDTTFSLSNDSVSNAILANMAQGTIKGRAAGAGTGDPTDLTGTQVTAILDTFTTLLKGLVPASGGGTTNFLRADGTFAAPPAGQALTLLGSAAASGATTTVALSSSSSPLLFIVVNQVSHNSGSPQSLRVAISDDGTTFGTAVQISIGTFTSLQAVGGVAVVTHTNATASKNIVSAVLTLLGGVEASETGPTTHLQFSASGGNLDAGTLLVYGFI